MFTLNAEMVEKVIRYYTGVCGRQVDAAGIRCMAARFTGTFRTASDCADAFKCDIWNAGLVR
jgi:hypothetical protein